MGRLLAAFSQAKRPTWNKYGGTGLDVAVGRHFCRVMGGGLTVESSYGRGSTFTVRLPAVVPEPVVRGDPRMARMACVTNPRLWDSLHPPSADNGFTDVALLGG